MTAYEKMLYEYKKKKYENILKSLQKPIDKSVKV